MAWSTIFANLAAGNQPLSLFDTMFAQVASLSAIPCTAASNNAISLTGLANSPTLTSYSRYVMFRFIAAATSTGLVTINYQGIGALNVYKADGATQVGANDILVGQLYLAIYDSALNAGAGGFYLEGQALTGASFSGIVVGTNVSFPVGVAVNPAFLMAGTTIATKSLAITAFGNDNNPPNLQLAKSRNATIGSHTIVANGDVLGRIIFYGSDGNVFAPGAQIEVVTEATAGASDMPALLRIMTTPDGTAVPAEAIRFDSQQRVTVGSPGTQIGSRFEVHSTAAVSNLIAVFKYSADAAGPICIFGKVAALPLAHSPSSTLVMLSASSISTEQTARLLLSARRS